VADQGTQKKHRFKPLSPGVYRRVSADRWPDAVAVPGLRPAHGVHELRDRRGRRSAELEGAAAAGDVDRCAMAKLSDEQRAALQMLAASARGYTLSTLAAHGFVPEMLHDLVRAGCATVHRTAFSPGASKIVNLRITAAGRKAIAE
jgi:hypothetical protein